MLMVFSSKSTKEADNRIATGKNYSTKNRSDIVCTVTSNGTNHKQVNVILEHKASVQRKFSF